MFQWPSTTFEDYTKQIRGEGNVMDEIVRFDCILNGKIDSLLMIPRNMHSHLGI